MSDMKEKGYGKYDILLFDGVCNLCNSSLNFIIRHDKKNQFKFAALQSDIGKKLVDEYFSNLARFEQDEAYQA